MSFPKIISLCGFLFLSISACSSISPEIPNSTQAPILYEDAVTAETAPQMEELGRLGRGSIYGMSVSPDGETLAVSTTMGVWIYRLPDGEVVRYFEGKPLDSWFNVPDIAWSPDGQFLAVGQKSNGVSIWNTQSWELVAERDGVYSENGYPVSDLPGIAWSPDGQFLAAGSGMETVWVWNRSLRTWEDWSQYSGQQIGLTWTPEGQLLLIGGGISESGVFDVLTGDLVYPLNHGVDGCCGQVVWSPDGKLALIMFDLGGGVVDVQNNEYAFWAGYYPKSAWSSDGLYFATTLYGGTSSFGVYDTRTYELIFDEPMKPVNALAWTPDNDLLAAGDVAGEKVLWNVYQDEKLFSLNEHYDDSSFFIWEHDGLALSDFSTRPYLRVLDATNDTYLLSVDQPSGFYNPVLSSDHSVFAVIDREQQLTIWRVNSDEPDLVVNTHLEDRISHTAISPDGDYIAIGDSNDVVRVWDTTTGKQVAALTGDYHPVDDRSRDGHVIELKWSPDGESLVVIRYKGPIKQYAVHNWTVTTLIDGNYNTQVNWLWNGAMLISWGENNKYVFWDMEGEEELLVIDDATGGISNAIQSPDGKKVAFTVNHQYQIWDMENQELLIHLGDIRFGRLAWSPDSRLVAMGSDSGTLHILDLETGEMVIELPGHQDIISRIFWSQDGSRLYTGSLDGTFRIWGIP